MSIGPGKKLLHYEILDKVGEVGSPRHLQPLFRVDTYDSPARQYDTLDGKRFLVNVNARPDATTPLTVVQGWLADR